MLVLELCNVVTMRVPDTVVESEIPHFSQILPTYAIIYLTFLWFIYETYHTLIFTRLSSSQQFSFVSSEMIQNWTYRCELSITVNILPRVIVVWHFIVCTHWFKKSADFSEVQRILKRVHRENNHVDLALCFLNKSLPCLF